MVKYSTDVCFNLFSPLIYHWTCLILCIFWSPSTGSLFVCRSEISLRKHSCDLYWNENGMSLVERAPEWQSVISNRRWPMTSIKNIVSCRAKSTFFAKYSESFGSSSKNFVWVIAQVSPFFGFYFYFYFLVLGVLTIRFWSLPRCWSRCFSTYRMLFEVICFNTMSSARLTYMNVRRILLRTKLVIDHCGRYSTDWNVNLALPFIRLLFSSSMEPN